MSESSFKLSLYSERQKETHAQLNEWRPEGHKGGVGGYRSGVLFLFQPFQLSPSTLVTIYEHDLPTFQLPHSALGANLSNPPTTSNQPPVHLWHSDPLHIAHLDRKNLLLHAKAYVHYVCIQCRRKTTHKTGPPAFTLRGQCLFFSTGSKVSNKKIQYSKWRGSPAYQYIIQKRDRWQPISRWKAIEFSVSRYLAISGCINLQLLIIELRRRRD